MSEYFPGGGSMEEKFGNFPGKNLQEIFRGNVRECLIILGDFYSTAESELWRNPGPSAFQLQENMSKSDKI